MDAVYDRDRNQQLDLEEIKQLIMNQASDFIPKMIQNIHANPDRPRYQNIFYDDYRKKAMWFVKLNNSNQMTWQLAELSEVTEKMTEKIKSHVNNNRELNSLFPDSDNDDEWNAFVAGMNTIHKTTVNDVLEPVKNVLIKAKYDFHPDGHTPDEIEVIE